jgi:hypothetical protein
MKKYFLLCLMLIIFFTLHACGGGSSNNSNSTGNNENGTSTATMWTGTDVNTLSTTDTGMDTGSGYNSDDLTASTQRALDYQEIANVAGKHEYYHTALRHADELNNIWAQEADDISWTNNGQKYSGRDEVYKFYVTDLASNLTSSLQSANAIDSSIEIKDANLGTGVLWYHTLNSPLIEVAGDGKTAKGIWMSFGTVTGPQGASMTAQWTCETYGIDFIKENSKWKIWHLRLWVYFYTDVDGHWYNTSDNTAFSSSGNTYNQGYSLYTIASSPKMPEPYDTWDNTFSY